MSGSATEVYVVLCTVPPAQATALADRLLAERLVACVNLVGPMRSRYRWQGEIEQADEMLLVMKTTGARRPALRERIVALHEYEVPEVLELPAAGGLAAYLAWVGECCADGGGAG
jgi:periplasmic divalent cation tolerance protein